MSVGTEFPSDSHGAGDRAAERRAVSRYSLIAEVEVFDPIERTKLKASVSEIGAHGCYIRVPDPLREHTVIQLLIQRRGETFKSWGMVVYVHEGRGMGINFFRPEPSQVKTLLSWIGDLRVQRQAL
jgi:hypothetical protein